MSKRTPSITEAEWLILQVLWDRSPAPAEHVVDRLSNRMDWHPRTVKTLLHRLVRKGAVNFTRDGKRYLYSARLGRDQCVREATRSFLSRIFGGKAGAAILHMVEEERLSPDEIARLRRLLDDRVSRRKSEGR
jgi:BlaI family penicillinase repressor